MVLGISDANIKKIPWHIYNNKNKKEVKIDGSIHVEDHIRLKTPPRC
jgi:hypothetical protein